MPDKQKELEDLAKADSDIAKAEHVVAEQVALIEHLADRGQSTEEAEAVLRNFEDTLAVFRDHRALIVDTLRHLA
jgi:hypothetical protein